MHISKNAVLVDSGRQLRYCPCTSVAASLLLKPSRTISNPHHVLHSPRQCSQKPGTGHRLGTSTWALQSGGAAAAVAVAASTAGGSTFQIPFGSLIVASLMPVVKVAMLCAVGAMCAARGFLTPEGRRVISALVYHVFVPALFFSRLGAGVSLADACRLWPLTANMVLSHVLGWLLGWLLVRLTQPPQYLRKHMMLSIAVGNVGNLPLVLVESLASDPALAFLGCSPQLALQYVILSNLSATLIQFPLAYLMLGPQPRQNLIAAGPQGDQAPHDTGSRPQEAAGSTGRLDVSGGQASPPWWSQGRAVLEGVLGPPSVACLLGITVSSVPLLKGLLFGPSSPLKLVGELTFMLGDMTIPSLMLVLGANLAKGPGAVPVPAASVIATAVGRLLLLPVLGTVLVAGPYAAGWLGALDPMNLVVMMIAHATPTAILVHSTATMMRNREDEVSVILFWQYMACLVTLPACMALFLAIAARLTC